MPGEDAVHGAGFFVRIFELLADGPSFQVNDGEARSVFDEEGCGVGGEA